MTTSAPPVPDQNQHSKHPAPVLRVTIYDRVSSFMMATVVGLFAAVIVIIAICKPGQPPVATRVFEYELVTGAGGRASGVPDETLHVESPEDPSTDASAIDAELSEERIEETLETVEELADSALWQVEQVTATADLLDAKPGSANGTGNVPLGEGDETSGGGPGQRWLIQFAEAASIDEYARQLDFFEIELGAWFPDRGELVYLSNVSGDSPMTRIVQAVDDERLFMMWQGGRRREADAELFERAGVDVSGAELMHFYSPESEELLSRLEQSYANRPASQIRRTYFVVVKQGSGYSFVVTLQRYSR